MDQDLQEEIEYIKTMEELSDDEKNKLLSMLENGENPVEVLAKIEDILQEKIDAVFESAGVTLEESNPEYQAKYQEMLAEMQAAELDFNQEMDAIKIETDHLKDVASEEIDQVKIEAIKSKIAN
jgi:hypothetical protein